MLALLMQHHNNSALRWQQHYRRLNSVSDLERGRTGSGSRISAWNCQLVHYWEDLHFWRVTRAGGAFTVRTVRFLLLICV